MSCISSRLCVRWPPAARRVNQEDSRRFGHIFFPGAASAKGTFGSITPAEANDRLAIDHDGSLSVETIAALIASGYNGGAWDGPGIVASSALLDPTVFGLGYAENGDAEAIPDPYNSDTNLFFGIPVDGTTVLVKFTWLGDLNLDGFVNFSDLVVFNGEFDDGATTGRFWFEGDFDYDGDVDFSDLVIFNGAYDENKVSMPEPMAVAPAGLLVSLLATGRRRRA
jgi:hypothetical protein